MSLGLSVLSYLFVHIIQVELRRLVHGTAVAVDAFAMLVVLKRHGGRARSGYCFNVFNESFIGRIRSVIFAQASRSGHAAGGSSDGGPGRWQ